ncbi:hypothetical protein N789_07095 [Arenimonas oryziterrae DSM 21050 = YC6267]|uniref:Uncharacterized protein n=2 Tax=Arenimonas TaxID=490567 RepID=A0A091AXJ0_9GAMM|nr:hypothetical protein N789_07095 [Arenimonas oryziterrae DSM 21050 = YC6267]
MRLSQSGVQVRLLVALAFVLWVCVCCSSPSSDSTSVYHAVFAHFGAEKSPVYVIDRPADPSSFDPLKDARLPGPLKFEIPPTTLSPAFLGAPEAQVLSDDELRSLFRSNCRVAWALFHGHHRDANVVLRLSPVGYTPARDHAVVFVASTNVATARSNCLGTVGFAVVLKRVDGLWQFEKTVDLFVS